MPENIPSVTTSQRPIERRSCAVKGCSNPGRRKGQKVSGAPKYGRLCQTHHCKKLGIVRNYKHDKFIKDLSKQPCARCGWNESYCDRHRLIPHAQGGKYVKGNVIPLCPNCHRIETYGRLIKPTSKASLPSEQILPN